MLFAQNSCQTLDNAELFIFILTVIVSPHSSDQTRAALRGLVIKGYTYTAYTVLSLCPLSQSMTIQTAHFVEHRTDIARFCDSRAGHEAT